ncbi:MAG: class I SAM-dependent rRNA methyltransferase [Bryobacteraceae bacterium]
MTHSVRVNRHGADRISAGHVWIFSSDVINRGEAPAGEAVRVLDPKGRTLGAAHYSSASQICLRMLSSRPEAIGGPFLEARLAAAAAHRERVVSDTDAYRVVHAEGDLLPALIVDRYGDYLSVQTLDQGMDRARHWVIASLIKLLAPKGIVLRNDAAVREKEELPLETSIVHGEVPPRVALRMNGLQFFADLMGGQKTGTYLDQRENYFAARRYARGNALDCFTSSGGFALHLASQCDSVEAIDSSASAIASANENKAANAIENVEFREADVFELLAGHVNARRQFATIVLDPPAFTKSRGSVEAALRGYKEINLRALRLLAPGGTLITCSCSHHISESMLAETLAAASLDAGRRLRVLERRTQAQDHPILLTVPETHYLKCFIVQSV